jgi:hypothetical protein
MGGMPPGAAPPAGRASAGGYAERISRRRSVWWGRPRLLAPGSWSERLHRLREHHTYLAHDAPEAAWRCCERWQRQLSNKWNAREFATRHGCRVPALYWHGRAPWKIPFESLAPRYVVRPCWGEARRGVHVVADGRELLRGEPASAPEVRGRLVREMKWVRLDRFLVEELIPREGHGEARLPLEYKCYVFGARVGVIEVIDRPGVGAKARWRHYTPPWNPAPGSLSTFIGAADDRPAPPFLEAMLDAASRIGREVGTHLRVDFFSAADGFVFDEFATTPVLADRRYITPLGDEVLGRIWQEEIADAV